MCQAVLSAAGIHSRLGEEAYAQALEQMSSGEGACRPDGYESFATGCGSDDRCSCAALMCCGGWQYCCCGCDEGDKG